MIELTQNKAMYLIIVELFVVITLFTMILVTTRQQKR